MTLSKPKEANPYPGRQFACLYAGTAPATASPVLQINNHDHHWSLAQFSSVLMRTRLSDLERDAGKVGKGFGLACGADDHQPTIKSGLKNRAHLTHVCHPLRGLGCLHGLPLPRSTLLLRQCVACLPPFSDTSILRQGKKGTLPHAHTPAAQPYAKGHEWAE